MCDWILGKGMKVGEMKKEILQEIKRKYSIDIPYDRSVWQPELMAFCKRKYKYKLSQFQVGFLCDVAVCCQKKGLWNEE